MSFWVKQSGFSLFEILVAWFIAMVVLLGLLKVQVFALQSAYSNYWQSMAVIQMSNFIERLHANSTSAFRERDFLQWNKRNREVLPQGVGYWHCQAHVCQLKLQWRVKQLHALKIKLVSV